MSHFQQKVLKIYDVCFYLISKLILDNFPFLLQNTTWYFLGIFLFTRSLLWYFLQYYYFIIILFNNIIISFTNICFALINFLFILFIYFCKHYRKYKFSYFNNSVLSLISRYQNLFFLLLICYTLFINNIL